MFWDNFSKLCQENGTTPNAVCKELGLSSAAATHWKQGSEPRRIVLEKIADRFNTTVGALLFDDIDVQIADRDTIEQEKKKIPLAIGIDFGTTSSGIIGTVQKESLPIKTTRSEMFNILSQLTDDELDDLLNYAQFLLSKR